MKRVFAWTLLVLWLVSMAFVSSCSQRASAEEDSLDSSYIYEYSTLFSDKQDTGRGNIYITAASGTSERGEVPVLTVTPGNILIQINLVTEDFDLFHLTYVYVDGSILCAQPFENSRQTLNLSGSALKEGLHHIEVVQYENNRDDSEVITYKTASYEVREQD